MFSLLILSLLLKITNTLQNAFTMEESTVFCLFQQQHIANKNSNSKYQI